MSVLMLEGNWQNQTDFANAMLYQRILPITYHALDPQHNAIRIRQFIQQCPPQQYAILLLSGHGKIEQQRRLLWMQHSYIDIVAFLAALNLDFSRTLLILDACEIGRRPPEIQQQLGCAGILGFQHRVNWQAASIFIIQVLRYWRQHPDIQALAAHLNTQTAWLNQLGVQYILAEAMLMSS